METKDLKLDPNSINRTMVGDKVVSTITLSEDVKAMDSVLGLFDDVLDRPANLATPGDYETMVFPCDTEGEITDFEELDFARYSTKGEALLGHTAMVEKWSKEV